MRAAAVTVRLQWSLTCEEGEDPEAPNLEELLWEELRAEDTRAPSVGAMTVRPLELRAAERGGALSLEVRARHGQVVEGGIWGWGPGDGAVSGLRGQGPVFGCCMCSVLLVSL